LRKITSRFLLSFSLLSCLYLCLPTTAEATDSKAMDATSAAAETMDGIAAIINGNALTCYQVEQDAIELREQLVNSGMKQLPDEKQLFSRALDRKVTLLIQEMEAKKLEISVSDDELDQAMANIESQNNIPAGQLVEILKAQGMDIDLYKKTLRERLLTGKLSNIAVRSRLQISEEAIGEYYRKYIANQEARREIEISQIFQALPMDPTPEQISGAYKKMNAWRQNILEGASFARLAELHSTSPEASQGGGMGWFLPGALAPRFASVFSLKVGELSQVIRSPGGLHLFSITNERWQEPNKLAEAYDEIHARHILLKTSNLMSDTEKAKLQMRATQIAKEMQDATDEEFATRAKEISQGPSASKGGDLGWFKRGAMLPEFEEAAFLLDAEQTSDVVETQFGLHIIRIVERRHIEPDSLEAHHDNIQNTLLNIEMQDQLPRWLSGLKAKAKIEYRTCQ